MAVAYDNASSSFASAGVTSLTWAHNNLAGNALYACISVDGGAPQTMNASATYNGVAMTRIVNVTTSGQYLAVFRLLSPATGSHDVVVTWTGANGAAGAAISLTGVDTGTPNGTPVTSEGTGTTNSLAVSGAASDLALDFISVNNEQPATTSTTQTQRAKDGPSSAGWTVVGIASATGGASVSMGWSWSTSNRYGHAAINVVAAGGGSATWPGYIAPFGWS